VGPISRAGKRTEVSSVFIPIEANQTTFPDVNLAQSLPRLLEGIIALGELARQISQAMGGNGHREEAAGEIVSMLRANRLKVKEVNMSDTR
jgi:hypothetical protein